MNAPAVSIAIPLYNKADFVADAVRTALAQTFTDHEIVVIDDGSTDGGVENLRAIADPRLHVIRQDNAGVATARTRAMGEGRGRYVAFLDADDLWHPHHLHHLMQMVRQFPKATLFGNGFAEGAFDVKAVVPLVPTKAGIQSQDHWIPACAGMSGGPIDLSGESKAPVRYRLVEDYFAECAYDRAPLYTSSCMVLRERALDAGGFPIGNYCGEDLALWILLAADAPVAVSNFVGCHYRRGIDSLSWQSSYRNAPDISMTALDGLLKTHPDWPAERRQAVREYYFRLALAHGLDCLHAGESAEARNFLRLASGTQRQRRRLWQARMLAATPGPLRRVLFKSINRI